MGQQLGWRPQSQACQAGVPGRCQGCWGGLCGCAAPCMMCRAAGRLSARAGAAHQARAATTAAPAALAAARSTAQWDGPQHGSRAGAQLEQTGARQRTASPPGGSAGSPACSCPGPPAPSSAVGCATNKPPSRAARQGARPRRSAGTGAAQRPTCFCRCARRCGSVSRSTVGGGAPGGSPPGARRRPSAAWRLRRGRARMQSGAAGRRQWRRRNLRRAGGASVAAAAGQAAVPAGPGSTHAPRPPP